MKNIVKGLVHICRLSTVLQLFVNMSSDIAKPHFLLDKNDVDSKHQSEITTTLLDEHRCRIVFLEP